MEIHIGMLCDYTRGGGLSGAWRAEEDHIGYSSAVKHSSDYSALTKKMLLTDYIVNSLRTQKVGKLCVSHLYTPFL
jgi:hypothetical protein